MNSKKKSIKKSIKSEKDTVGEVELKSRDTSVFNAWLVMIMYQIIAVLCSVMVVINGCI